MKIIIAKAVVIAVAGAFSGLGVYAFFNETSQMSNFLGWANAAAYFFFHNWRTVTAIEELEDWYR